MSRLRRKRGGFVGGFIIGNGCLDEYLNRLRVGLGTRFGCVEMVVISSLD